MVYLPFRKASHFNHDRRLPLGASTPNVRIAQVSAPNHLFSGTRYFAPKRGSGLVEFQPQSLVGAAFHLMAVAQAVASGQIHLPHLQHPLFLTTDARELPGADSVRRQLWASLGVPVYEILLDSENLPVAYECEAREGWHAAPGFAFAQSADGQLWFHKRQRRSTGFGLKGSLTGGTCACGLSTPRIGELYPDYQDPLRADQHCAA